MDGVKSMKLMINRDQILFFCFLRNQGLQHLCAEDANSLVGRRVEWCWEICSVLAILCPIWMGRGCHGRGAE